MIASIKNKLIRLEHKQPQSQYCFPLDYFYGEPAVPELLVPGQTLSDFYNQFNKDKRYGS